MDSMGWSAVIFRFVRVMSLVASGTAFGMSCHSVISVPEPVFLAETQIEEFLSSPLPPDLYVLPLQKGEAIRRWRATARESAPVRQEIKRKGAITYEDYYFLIIGPNEQMIFATTDDIEPFDEYYAGVRTSYASILKLWLRSERGQLARAKDYPIHAVGKMRLSEKRNGAIQVHSFSVEPYWFEPDAPLPSEYYVRSVLVRSLGKNGFYKVPPKRIPWDRPAYHHVLNPSPIRRNGVEDLTAFVVEVERLSAKIGGSEEETPVSLRVTSIFRNEDGEWKLLHRHADPITSPRPAQSVVLA